MDIPMYVATETTEVTERMLMRGIFSESSVLSVAIILKK